MGLLLSKSRRRLFLLFLLVPLCMLRFSDRVDAYQFVENFDSRQFSDSVATTAHWDTLSNTLKLYPFELTNLGAFDTPNYAHRTLVFGDYLFVADGSSGIQIYNISDPVFPTPAGSYDTPDYAYDIKIEGDLAFVADRNSGLLVLDISNPTSPAPLGSYNTPSYALNVAVSGNYVYVANAGTGLYVIDVSAPAAPVLATSIPIPGIAHDLIIDGDYMYIACDAAGAVAVNISSPSAPVIIDTFDTAGTAYAIALEGDRIFIADWAFGVQVVDVSDPDSLWLIGTYDTPGAAYGIAIDGTNLYVADGPNGFQVYDVSNPATLVLRHQIDTPSNAKGIDLNGDIAWIADGSSGIRSVRIADQVSPVSRGNLILPGTAYDLGIAAEYAFVADGVDGIRVLDISDPSDPLPAGHLPLAGITYGVAVAGDFLYAATGPGGVEVVDVGVPDSPISVGNTNTSGSATAVVISGDFAYVADDVGGVYVLDVSLPASPVPAGSLNTAGSALALAVAGDLAYVADGSAGLQIVDITDPFSPSLITTYTTTDFSWDVALAGDFAYVADGSAGLQILDISNPASPSPVGNYDTPGFARGVELSGNYAFVSDNGGGLLVLDISNPSSPVLIGSYDAGGSVYNVAISNGYAYVAGGTSGFSVVEVFQSSFDLTRNQGRSSTVFSSPYELAAVKLTASSASPLVWDVSADGGSNWEPIVEGAPWTPLTDRGYDLLWQSTHPYSAPGVNPACDSLMVEWLYSTPEIDSIVDFPNDQGGDVRIHFSASGLDIPAQLDFPIALYNVWRRVESGALLKKIMADNAGQVQISSPFADLALLTVDGRRFFVNPQGKAAGEMPSGVWEVLGSFGATQMPQYITPAATLGDSTESGALFTVYCITAHTTTPSVWYAGAIDSGYSIDNIAPSAPANLALVASNTISWESAVEPDFNYYTVYLAADSLALPEGADLIGYTTDTSFVVPDSSNGFYLLVTATDFAGNESVSSNTVWNATGVSNVPGLPFAFSLRANTPNPFNPRTALEYTIARGMEIELTVLDLAGREIAVIDEGFRLPGKYSVRWDGTNRSGAAVASGVYFARLVGGNRSATQRMVLIR